MDSSSVLLMAAVFFLPHYTGSNLNDYAKQFVNGFVCFFSFPLTPLYATDLLFTTVDTREETESV